MGWRCTHCCCAERAPACSMPLRSRRVPDVCLRGGGQSRRRALVRSSSCGKRRNHDEAATTRRSRASGSRVVRSAGLNTSSIRPMSDIASSRRFRHRGLGAHPAAPNQIDAIVSVVPGNGVDERQCFDREAKSRELPAQRLEAFELVAQRRRALVLQAVARRFHLRAQAARSVRRRFRREMRAPAPAARRTAARSIRRRTGRGIS